MDHNKIKTKKKSILTMVSLFLVCTVVVGGIVAFIIANTNNINNTFTPSEVTCTVTEERNGGTKSNVKITNNSDTEAYIRAKFIVTWQDKDGYVYGEAPKLGTDYTLEALAAENSGWKLAEDGFYYYVRPVAPSASTSNLFDQLSIGQNANTPDEYSLNVEIIASAIQSVPATAVTESWSTGVSGTYEKDSITYLNIKPSN